jgi:Spy/CpxP family protein refolding chaperone
MKRVFGITVAALPLALLLATGAMADSSASGGHRAQWLKNKLGLSDDQAQKIEAIKTSNRDAQKQLHSQFRQAMTDARQAALNGDNVDDKNAAATKLFGQMLDLRAKELAQIGTVLTPDQRASFAALKGPGGHGRWKHHHGQGSPTPSTEG